MINSLLELIGALFLAALPIYVFILRLRRRQRRRAADADGSPAEPMAEQKVEQAAKTDATNQAGPQSVRRHTDGRPHAGEPAGSTPRYPQDRPDSVTTPRRGSSAVFSERVNRYPPLQRAFVLSEILGRPVGLNPPRGPE